ncbi:hypothetical protein [Streptomyces sp. NPDC096033]|uniref:hypothetical protein n=1 Tax=Streptomyces sp. NPDC096033 TaxID=3366071 RepID=UPI00381FD89C
MDVGPVQRWEGRRGRALYDLELEEARDRVRGVPQVPVQPWEQYQEEDPATHTSPYQNHLSRRLTVQQRQQRGLLGKWGRPLPPRRIDDLPEATCSWAPWY